MTIAVRAERSAAPPGPTTEANLVLPPMTTSANHALVLQKMIRATSGQRSMSRGAHAHPRVIVKGHRTALNVLTKQPPTHHPRRPLTMLRSLVMNMSSFVARMMRQFSIGAHSAGTSTASRATSAAYAASSAAFAYATNASAPVKTAHARHALVVQTAIGKSALSAA